MSSPEEKVWIEDIVAILSCLIHTELHFQGVVRCIHFRYTGSRIPNHTNWLSPRKKEKAMGRRPCYVCFIAYCTFYASMLRLPPSISHLLWTDTTSDSMLYSRDCLCASLILRMLRQASNGPHFSSSSLLPSRRWWEGTAVEPLRSVN